VAFCDRVVAYTAAFDAPTLRVVEVEPQSGPAAIIEAPGR